MDVVEDIKQRLNIEDVVAEYVELKRAGRNFKGLSPFSNERSPSFMVSPEKQIWHDFSSGKGGNMFSFVMEMEGLDFKGALEILARKAGLDIDLYRSKPTGRSKDRERLYEALELATRFYQAQLKNSQAAIQYIFKKRQFTRETALVWRLGYSPNNGTALVDFLKNKGFTTTEIKESGLSAQRYRGLGDMFRGRIMIPLADQQGRVIGFTARILEDDPNAPKYINTPQTPLYDKSRHVFGLHLAKEAIRRIKYVVVAEGNLDVISSHQADVRQVVATAGTAMTEAHLKALGRFTDDIRLCFDADSAGLSATERAIPIASKVNVNLSIISIPSGKDPDELIKQDPKIWRETIERNKEALDWLITRYKDLSNLDTQQGRKDFKNSVLKSLQRLESSGEKEIYAQKIAEILQYPNAGAILEELKLIKEEGRSTYVPTKVVQKKIPSVEEKKINEIRKLQNHLMCLVLLHPVLRSYVRPITPQMIPDDTAKTLLVFIHEHPDFTGEASQADRLKEIGDYVKMLALLYEELYQTVEPAELTFEAARLRDKLIEQYVKIEKQRLAHEMHSADETQITPLLEQAKQLDQLLKTYKGSA